jgi:hypothetical protein
MLKYLFFTAYLQPRVQWQLRAKNIFAGPQLWVGSRLNKLSVPDAVWCLSATGPIDCAFEEAAMQQIESPGVRLIPLKGTEETWQAKFRPASQKYTQASENS